MWPHIPLMPAQRVAETERSLKLLAFAGCEVPERYCLKRISWRMIRVEHSTFSLCTRAWVYTHHSCTHMHLRCVHTHTKERKEISDSFLCLPDSHLNLPTERSEEAEFRCPLTLRGLGGWEYWTVQVIGGWETSGGSSCTFRFDLKIG